MFARAASSTIPPRPMLTRMASGFMREISLAPIRPAVRLLRGACTETTSDMDISSSIGRLDIGINPSAPIFSISTNKPAEEMEKATEMHKALVEAAAENDETLMEKFFEEEILSVDEMREGIRKGLVTRSIFPVFCVCAEKDMGVRRLMEFLGNVVPFVSEMPMVHNTRGEEIPANSNGPESVFFFKTGMEPHIGEVSYFKVMSGCIRPGDDLTNADRGSKERIGQIFACAGANRIPVDQLNAGDIGCTVKLKDVKTGNTLNGKDAEWRFDYIKYPNSKYSRSIKAVNAQDTEKLMAAMIKMHQEDPTWVIEQSKELRQIIVHGQGEFHLRTLKWRLENNEKLNVEFGEPRIPYRETITKRARADTPWWVAPSTHASCPPSLKA